MFHNSESRATSYNTHVKDESSEQHNLDTVPEDIHRLIISELVDTSPTALLNLSQSSKTLHDASVPFMYRNLVLSRNSEDVKKSANYEVLLEKFKDTSCDIARHVRSIIVESELPSKDLLLMIESISERGRLRSVKWNTSAHIPPAVLSKLRSTWPDLELSATVIDRPTAENRQYQSMDFALLSSPLLTELTYVIYTADYDTERPCRSEWPKLTRALLSGGNIRSLHIRCQVDGGIRRGVEIVEIVDESEPSKLPRLDLVPGARLPKLEELRIVGWAGSRLCSAWDEAYCRHLRDAVDVSLLRVLDFGDSYPEHFFTTFTGLLPNVRSLKCGTGQGSMESMRYFIASLPVLETLFVDEAQRGVEELWPAIEGHKETLKSLVFGATWERYCRSAFVDKSVLEKVAKFPKLEHLGWHVPMGTIEPYGNQKKLRKQRARQIDRDYVSIISAMNLKRLEIFMCLPMAANEYSQELQQDAAGSIPHPPLDKEGSVAAAQELANTISRGKMPLQQLVMHLCRVGYEDRGQPYLMDSVFELRRNEDYTQGKGEKYSVRGNLEWYNTMQTSEQLLFDGF